MGPTLLMICIVVTLILLFIDYRQTLDIKNHEGYFEINPILGKHPGDSKITIYFIICAVIAAVVPYFYLTQLEEVYYYNIDLLSHYICLVYLY